MSYCTEPELVRVGDISFTFKVKMLGELYDSTVTVFCNRDERFGTFMTFSRVDNPIVSYVVELVTCNDGRPLKVVLIELTNALLLAT
jgi:hypothetical protein